MTAAEALRAMAKVAARVLPALLLASVVVGLEEGSAEAGRLQLMLDLGFGDRVFMAGRGLFLLAIVVFAVPSALVLVRVGGRRWLARLLAGWGLLTVLRALAPDATAFLTLQFLSGVALAGFFPGVLLVVNAWFPAGYRSRAVGLFLLASMLAQTLVPPLAVGLVELSGATLLRAWQLGFLGTGFAALLLAIVLLSTLPADASFLGPRQYAWVTQRLANEPAAAGGGWPRALLLGAWVLAATAGIQALGWASEAADAPVHALGSLPWLLGAVAVFCGAVQPRLVASAGGWLCLLGAAGMAIGLMDPRGSWAALCVAAAAAWVVLPGSTLFLGGTGTRAAATAGFVTAMAAIGLAVAEAAGPEQATPLLAAALALQGGLGLLLGRISRR